MKHKNIPEGYKDSPLGIIPKEWEVKTIGEVCDIYVGKDLNLNSYSKRCDNTHIYPVYSNTVDANGWYGGYYNFEEYKGNCVTVVGRGVGLGTAFYRDKGFGAIGRLLVLYSDKCDAKYLTEYINGKVEIFVESAAIPQLTGKQIANYRIAVPPINEQKKIAEILSVWDDAIEKQTRLIDALICRKRALMQQLLTGKKRLLYYTEPWKQVRLGNIFCEVNAINDKQQNYPVMTISAKLGLVSQQNKFDRIIAGNSLNKYTLLKKDDFAYNKGNSKTYPMGCIYKLDEYEYALVPFVYICFQKTAKINISFYQQWFINHGLDKQLKRIITSGARGDGLLNVDRKDFFNTTVPFPHFTEQQVIATILATADLEIELVKKRLDQFGTQKRSLMQQLLTGKKRIKT